MKLSRDGWAGRAVLAAALVLIDVLTKSQPRPLAKADYGSVVLHFAVFGLYVASLPSLGFRVATFAYIAATNALLDRPKSARG
ncbi:MAG TPA: hypothetical protein VGP97_06815, partial [Burkholderiales bacterium]|nr:hypothetical protein [Burkholderiales bacterium]